MQIIVGNVVWQLVRQSDLFTWIVLISLLALSIICWTIVVYKWMTLRTHTALLESLAHRVRAVRTPEEYHQLIGLGAQCGADDVLRVGLQGLQLTSEQGRVVWRELLASTVHSALTREEAHISLLKVGAEVSPLLGLLGTIWGLIHSFISISMERAADIVTVAPGIAEALITTLAGLCVAIPALLFFHMIQRKLQMVETALWSVADAIEGYVYNRGA